MRSPSLPLWLAAALALRGGLVCAQGSRASEAPVQTQRPSGTSRSTTPGLGKGLGAGTGVVVPKGVVGAGVNAAPGASGNASTLVPQPGAGGAQASGARASAGAASAQARALAGPGEISNPSGGAAAKTLDASAANPGASPLPSAGASGMLESAAREIKSSQVSEARGASGRTDDALKRIFDFEAARRRENAAAGFGAGSASDVAGRQLRVEGKIVQTARIADSASPHDAPALYEDAKLQAQEAARSKVLSPQVARSVADVVTRFALRRAARALPELANEAYKAAARGASGKPEMEKAFKSLETWERFIGGGPSRPLITNTAELKADVRRVLEAASAPGASSSRRDGLPRVAPRVSFSRAGDQFTADLSQRPAVSVVQRLAESVLIGFGMKTSDLSAPRPAAAMTETPGILEGAREIARSSPRGAVSAARYAARAATRALWERVMAAVSRIVGRIFPGRTVLGGQTLVSHERGLARLAALQRPVSETEAAFSRRAARAAPVVFLELGRLNRRAIAASRALAAPQADRELLLRLASEQAAEYQALSGDRSASAAVASLREAGDEASGGLAYWLGRIPQASLDLIDRRMLGVLDRQGLSAIAYGDLSEAAGGMMRLVTRRGSAALAADLQSLGFQTELADGGVLRAWGEGSGIEQRLEEALGVLAGAAPASAPDARGLGRAVADMAGRPDAAEREARRIRGFPGYRPVAQMQLQGQDWLAERLLRRSGGKVERHTLLRSLDSRGELLWGHTETLRAIPAR